jgi:hypothetical protein
MLSVARVTYRPLKALAVKVNAFYARSFSPGDERNQHLQIAISLRRLFRNEKWLDAHTIKGPQSASMSASRSAVTHWRAG